MLYFFPCLGSGSAGSTSASTRFWGATVRQLSLQFLFLPRDRKRTFSSNSGAVASDAPNHRKHNAPDTPPGLQVYLVWGRPSFLSLEALRSFS